MISGVGFRDYGLGINFKGLGASACAEAQRRLAWPMRKDWTRPLGGRGCFLFKKRSKKAQLCWGGS